MEDRTIVIEKRSACAIEVAAGSKIKITEIEGPQMAVLIAFNKNDLTEHFSPGNTRVSLVVGPFRRPSSDGTIPYWIEKDDVLVSSRWNRMLSLTEDTYGGHDIVFDPCDANLNANILGMGKDYPGCRELHAGVLALWGLEARDIPAGANLFQNTSYSGRGMRVNPTNAKKDDFVAFDVHMDLIVSITSCPFPLGEHRSIQLEIN